MAPVVITVILMTVYVLMCLLHYFLEAYSRRISMVEGGSNVGGSMSINDLEKLPCYDYVAKNHTSSPVDCAICLENLITGDKCRLLPMCKHSFHAQCVDRWLLKTPNCPICRSNVDSHSGNYVIGNDVNCIVVVVPSQLDDNLVQLRESHESGPPRNFDIELIESPTLGSVNSGHGGVEPREQQNDTSENQIASTTSCSRICSFVRCN